MSEEPNNSSNVEDEEERRMAPYQELQNDVEELGIVYSNVFVNKTNAILEKSTDLLTSGSMLERTEHPIQQVLSSKIVFDTSIKIKRCTKNINGNSNIYDPKEFQNLFKNNKILWMQTFSKRVSGMYSLNGVIKETEVTRERKERKKVVKESTDVVTQPEIVDASFFEEQTDEVSTTMKKVNRCYKTNGYKPLNYLQLVLNPESYKKTIENIFNLSCAIHEGHLNVTLVEDLPHVTPLSKREKRHIEEQKEKSIYNKFIFSISMAKWKEMVEVFSNAKTKIENLSNIKLN